MMKRNFIKTICLLVFYAMTFMFFETENLYHLSVIEIQASTKKTSKRDLQKKYVKWLDEHKYNYNNADNDYAKAKIQYVDIDGNGIIDMIYSSYGFGNVVLTYNKDKGKVIKLIEQASGKGGFAYYNKKKKMISLSSSSTGDVTTSFYEVSSKKVTKTKKIVSWRDDVKDENGYYQHVWKYEIDGKSVSEKRYKKALKSALKGYKKVTPKDEFRY